MKELLNKRFLLFFSLALFLSACVSKKDFLAMQGSRDAIQASLDEVKKKLADLEMEKNSLEGKIGDLEGTIGSQKGDLKAKEAQIAAIESQIEAIKTQNLDFENGLKDLALLRDGELKELKQTLATMESEENKKSAASKALASNLTKSLDANNSNGDIIVYNKGSLVHISLSDKVLFNPGRASLVGYSSAILSNVAKVLNDNPNIDVLVEGHTDNDPITFTSHKSNWELSVKRAMAVVNTLHQNYNIAPSRLIPAGRGEHKPKGDNSTEEGKKINRRTEITLIPRVDQYLRLLSTK